MVTCTESGRCPDGRGGSKRSARRPLSQWVVLVVECGCGCLVVSFSDFCTACTCAINGIKKTSLKEDDDHRGDVEDAEDAAAAAGEM